MIETFLSRRDTLQGIVVSMDIRRTPGTEDSDLLHWLEHYNIARILVITKTDKLSKNKQIKQVNQIIQTLGIERDEVILFSAKTRLGKDAVWEAILSLLEGNHVSD
jgi:GTP-binding protein